MDLVCPYERHIRRCSFGSQRVVTFVLLLRQIPVYHVPPVINVVYSCLLYTSRSAVLIIHGDKAHSCYMGRDAFAHMMDGNPVPENKELFIIPGASHTDLYDGGGKDAIPFDKIESFYKEYLI